MPSLPPHGRALKPSVVVALGLVLALLALPLGCRPRVSAPPAPIRIALGMQPGAALMILAREQGFFEQEGLAPTYTTHPSGKRALVDGLFGGRADVASAADLPVAEELRTGRDLAILATLQSARATDCIVARKDRGIAGIADLAGKRVGTQETSAVHFFLDRALTANGVEPARVIHVYYKTDQLVAALAAGEIDAMSMREPFVSQALARLGANGVALEAPWVYPRFEVLVSRRGYAESHAGEMQRVLRALLHAERFVAERPAEAEASLARALNLSPQVVRRMLDQTLNRVGLTQALLPMLSTQLHWLGAEAPASGKLLDALDLAPLQAVDPTRIDIAGFSQHLHP